MNLMTSKPLKSKRFYLDLGSIPNSETLKKDLELMGGREVFWISEASFVVSNRPGIKSETSPATTFAFSKSNSPHLFSTLDNLNSPAPSVFSPGFDLKHPIERIKPVSRGSMLLMKATEKARSKKTDFLELCRQNRVKIYPLQKVLQYIEKFKHKYLKNHKPVKDQDKLPVVTKITPPFIKFQDINGLYKPKYKSFCSSKIVDTSLFKCATKIVRNIKSSEGSEINRPVLRERSVMSQIKNETCKTEAVSISKVPGCYSISHMSVCGPVNGLKEGQDNQYSTNATKKKKLKKQYCEICQVNFSNGDAHFEKDSHKKFLNDPSNYDVVREAISGFPSVEDFLAKYTADDASTKDLTEDIQLFEDPNNVETCSNKDSSNSDRPLEIDMDNCLTEAYSFNNDFFVSPSCSTRSTPLPFLENDESRIPKRDLMPAFSFYNTSENTQSAFTPTGTFRKPQEFTCYNSFITDHGLCTYSTTNNVEVITSRSFPNDVGNFQFPLNFSCDNQIETVDLPPNLVSGNLNEAKGQINALDYTKTNLLCVEQYTSGLDFFPRESNLISCEAPLDLSCNVQNAIDKKDPLADEVDVGDFTAYNNDVSAFTFDAAKVGTDNNSNCLMNAAKISDDNFMNNGMINIDVLAPGVMKSSNEFLGGLKPISLTNSTVENQMNVSIPKLDEASDTENYFDSDSDEDLSKMVSSCIEEVDKNIERNSPNPDSLNNQHLLSCTNVYPCLQIISDKTVNNISMPATEIGTLYCELNDKFPESSGKRNLEKYSSMNFSPPEKRKCFGEENSLSVYQSDHALTKGDSKSVALASAVTEIEFEPNSSPVLKNDKCIQPLITGKEEELTTTSNSNALVQKQNAAKSPDHQLLTCPGISVVCETEISADHCDLVNAEKLNEIGRPSDSVDASNDPTDISELNKLRDCSTPPMTVQTSDNSNEHSSCSSAVKLNHLEETDSPPKIFAYSDVQAELSGEDRSDTPPVLIPEVNFTPDTVHDWSKTPDQSCIHKTDENCSLLTCRLDAPMQQETLNVQVMDKSANNNSEMVQDVEYKCLPSNLSFHSDKLNLAEDLKKFNISSECSDLYIVVDETSEIDSCMSTLTEYDVDSSMNDDEMVKVEIDDVNDQTSINLPSYASNDLGKINEVNPIDEVLARINTEALFEDVKCTLESIIKDVELTVREVENSPASKAIKCVFNSIKEKSDGCDNVVKDQDGCTLSNSVSKQLEENHQVEATKQKTEAFMNEMDAEGESLFKDVECTLDSVVKDVEVVTEIVRSAVDIISNSIIQHDFVAENVDHMDQAQKCMDESSDKMEYSVAITTSKNCDESIHAASFGTEPLRKAESDKVYDTDSGSDESISSANEFDSSKNETSCISSIEYVNGFSGSSNLSDLSPNEYGSVDVNFPVDALSKTVHIVYLNSPNNACA